MRLEEELKMKSFESEFQRAVLNVIFTGLWLTEKINTLLKPFDLSEQQFNVLRILRGQKGNPINMYSIQERMLHRMSNATRLVDKLEKKGSVKRVVCEANRRKVEITITPKGLKVLKDIESAIKTKGHMDPLKKRWSQKESKQIADLLDKLRE